MSYKNILAAFDSYFQTTTLDSRGSARGLGGTSDTTSYTPGNGYIYHIFTGPGTLSVSKGGYADYLIIAGGGGGGAGKPPYRQGGGGGAGGMISGQYLFPIGDYTIAVGGGGGAGASGSPSYISRNGVIPYVSSPFYATTLTAFGGGYGGRASPYGTSGGLGGSGGGGGESYSGGASVGPTSYPFIVPLGIPVPQGSSGGASPYPNSYASGGGGAGGAGSASSPTSTSRGIGAPAWGGDSGIPSDFGTPGPSPGRWFAQGGSGGGGYSSNYYNGGGGGSYDSMAATKANSGSGGSGGDSPGSTGGGGGASGLVIIRYPY